MSLGRITRVNSWDVFIAPHTVIAATLHILVSVELLALTALFGLFVNTFYFLLRIPMTKYALRVYEKYFN
jgi:uncharacterized membrane protein